MSSVLDRPVGLEPPSARALARPAASSCEVRRFASTPLPAALRHPWPQLLITCGSLALALDDGSEETATPCSVLLLEPGQAIASLRAAVEGEFVCIAVEPAQAARIARLSGWHQPARAAPTFPHRHARLAAEDFLALRVGLRDPEDGERWLGWVRRVLHGAVAEPRGRGLPGAQPSAALAARIAVIQHAAARLDAQWQANVPLQELAASARLSPCHLLRAFRRQLGQTPHQFTLQLRLRRSLPRLERRPGRLADLAGELGFSSHGHYSTAFRRAFGVRPGDYAALWTTPGRGAC